MPPVADGSPRGSLGRAREQGEEEQAADGPRQHRRQELRTRSGAESAARLPLRAPRPALFLLASGAGIGRLLPALRRHPVRGRRRPARSSADGLHDAGAGRHANLHRRGVRSRLPQAGDRVADGEPSARLPGVRRRRRVPSAGHDGDGWPLHAPLRRQQAHLAQPVSRPLHRPRDEPLHHLLPLRALLPRLRRRHRSGRLRLAFADVLRPPGGRRSGERVRRQSRRGVPHRRVHGQAVLQALQPQVGFAVRAVGMPRLLRRLQHLSGGALRRAQARPQPLPRPSERLLPLRPRALWFALRQQRQAHPPGWRARRGRRVRGARKHCGAGRSRGAAARRHRGHRVAAGVGGDQLRSQAAGRGGELLHRPGRRRSSGPGGGTRGVPRRRLRRSVARRRRTGGRGADPRRRPSEHRGAHGAGRAASGSRRHLRHGGRRRHSTMAGRRRARPRPGGEESAVHRLGCRHAHRRTGECDAPWCAGGVGSHWIRHRRSH